MPRIGFANESRETHARRDRGEPTLRQHDVLDALVAACALVAFADGKADAAERRKLIGMMRRLPTLEGFSKEDLDDEFSRNVQAFEEDVAQARETALAKVRALCPNEVEMRMLLRACDEIVHADGVALPQEYEALSSVGRALDR
jgi:tellurite resistance protein